MSVAEEYNVRDIMGMFEEPSGNFGVSEYIGMMDEESWRDKMLRLAALSCGPNEWAGSGKVDVSVSVPERFRETIDMICRAFGGTDFTGAMSTFVEQLMMTGLIAMAEHYKCSSNHDARDKMIEELRKGVRI